MYIRVQISELDQINLITFYQLDFHFRLFSCFNLLKDVVNHRKKNLVNSVAFHNANVFFKLLKSFSNRLLKIAFLLFLLQTSFVCGDIIMQT